MNLKTLLANILGFFAIKKVPDIRAIGAKFSALFP